MEEIEIETKYQGFIRNLQKLLLEKEIKIKELENVKKYTDKAPPKHQADILQILQFKLNRTEKELSRLEKRVVQEGQAKQEDIATQTERNLSRKHETLLSIDMVLKDLASSLSSILDSAVSPIINQELQMNGIQPQTCRLQYINISIEILKSRIQQLEENCKRAKIKYNELESTNDRLQESHDGLSLVFKDQLDRLDQIERQIQEREKVKDALDKQIAAKSAKIRNLWDSDNTFDGMYHTQSSYPSKNDEILMQRWHQVLSRLK